MEAVVKVTNYDGPPTPPVSPNQSGMFARAHPHAERQRVRRERGGRTARSVFEQEIVWPSPP